MTDTTNGYRALPWRSEGYRVFDADGIEVANTFTPELALGSAKAVAKDIVDAVNAYYGDNVVMWKSIREQLDAKDARIADLERKLKRAHDTMADLHRDWTREEARAVKAKADLSYYKTASKNFEDSYWEANKRAEAAEDRLKKAEVRLNLFLRYLNEDQEEIIALEKRAEDAEARVRDLEFQLEGATESLEEARGAVESKDTFTAPDGRVFRVGQRVWHTNWEDFATIEGPGISAVFGFGIPVRREERIEKSWPDSRYLRRVWDGLEEPDVPVGTVLRDAEGDTWKKTAKGQWTWVDVPGDFPAPWGQGMPKYGPYVEVLSGDDY